MGADAMIAYSRNGYENRSWTLPEAWKNVIEAKVCRITDEGRSESETRKLRDGKLELTLAKDEMLLIEKP
jgi:hypothetical protein